MKHVRLTYDQLVAFHLEEVPDKTARHYAAKLENAINPHIIVEKRFDKKYNVIGGFKYVSALKSTQKKVPTLCFVVGPFKSEAERKLAILQQCITEGEDEQYKELLIYELMHECDLDEYDISEALGKDAFKIDEYMYQQIIPRTYLKKAIELGIKPLIQAIFFNRLNSFQEKCLLTELALVGDTSLRGFHLPQYRKYRETYMLFDDFTEAINQLQLALHSKKSWRHIPHPRTYPPQDNWTHYEIYTLYS
ncbi:hypothetical protein [Salinibacillus xinjiangensis]|uniref:Uncharacterized protein n=1 Tax=Salinibacillus xinjiangensis TaxID=1229268 RepID=A0A6G1X1W2_9BACI|nr:hypothetical protein [Salinibacillus xinjiangensis]MRG84987.1 hypothetical protein [Salinibacillus xinjiangensis]